MPTPITSLTETDTFNTWFNTTNSAINALNGISMYKGFAGDGIGITYTNSGNYTFSHADTVTTGVTFDGNIKFNGTVTFAGAVPSISSTTISITPAVSGLTAGNVVRVDSVLGLTFAVASSASGSEVLGIVVDKTASSTVVATYGSINNTGFAKTIGNILGISGGTLSPGQAYFLSPTVPGGITTVEPTSYGQVSKPILLGITGTSGAILPYRGILIEGISAGISAELDNKIVVQIDYSGGGYYDATMNELGTTASIKPGDLVYLFPDNLASENVISGGTEFDVGSSASVIGLIDNVKLSGKLNTSSFKNIIVLKYNQFDNPFNVADTTKFHIGPNFLGLVSNLILDTGTSVILEITTPGGSFTTKIADLDTGFYPPTQTAVSGAFTLQGPDNIPMYAYGKCTFKNTSIQNSSGLLNFNNNNPTYKFLDFIKTDATTAVITLDKTQNIATFNVDQLTSSVNTVTSQVNALAGLTGQGNTDLCINGSFRIWQRGVTGLTTGSLNTFSTPFADRWFVVKNPELCTGITLSVERQNFTGTEGVFGGSPYYIDVACRFSGITSTRSLASMDQIYPRIEHIQKGARLGLDRTLYLSFWAKTVGGVTGIIPQIHVTRYADNPFADITTVANFSADGNGITHSIQNSLVYYNGTINSASGTQITPTWSRYDLTIPSSQWLHRAGWRAGETTGIRNQNSNEIISISGEEDGWYGIGFGIGGLTAGTLGGVTLSIAQVQLDVINYAKNVLVDTQQELLKCEPYYQTTYELGQTAGCPDETSLNHQRLQIGNLNTQLTYFIEFPTEMVQSPVVGLYTPSGIVGDIFNVSSGSILTLNPPKKPSYTYPWSGGTSFTRIGSGSGSLPYSNVAVSATGKRGMDISFNTASGPVASLDEVKFHYTADADFKLQ
jgi:hypothetical protein